ncbi:MAG: hypothetical protein WEB60_07115 [Terrimicrobiaceae bacterium]
MFLGADVEDEIAPRLVLVKYVPRCCVLTYEMPTFPRSRWSSRSPDEINFQTICPADINWSLYEVIVCPEDNIAQEIAGHLPRHSRTRLIGTQGASVLHTPHIRLRIDYRRLGRSAASYLLHGTHPTAIRATLVKPE